MLAYEPKGGSTWKYCRDSLCRCWSLRIGANPVQSTLPWRPIFHPCVASFFLTFSSLYLFLYLSHLFKPLSTHSAWILLLFSVTLCSLSFSKFWFHWTSQTIPNPRQNPHFTQELADSPAVFLFVFVIKIKNPNVNKLRWAINYPLPLSLIAFKRSKQNQKNLYQI